MKIFMCVWRILFWGVILTYKFNFKLVGDIILLEWKISYLKKII
jgi:hypothetical protein